MRRAQKELHQSQRQAARLMKRILTHFKAEMDEQLRPYGVTKAQIQMLWAIRDAPGSSGAHLSRQCEVTPQTAQELIQKAEESGWIVRAKDNVNDRIVTASLSAAGEELLLAVDREVRAIETRLWKGVSSESIDGLIGVLEQCATNLDRE